jgi:hypothetical protein
MKDKCQDVALKIAFCMAITFCFPIIQTHFLAFERFSL